jgi:DNA repair exonuclease SbcCD ATPase subunit
MIKPFEELADNMTDIIRKMYKKDDIVAKFNISGKANSFTFGLIRNGTYIPYDLLSSGEKCLYTLALMICITNTNKSPLRLMICDDMFDHLDSTTIESTFDILGTINDIQFIFAGVKPCKNAEKYILKIA